MAKKIGIYINGALAKSGTFTDPATCSFAQGNPFRLGLPGSPEYYIDNVRIYKTALPIAAIRAQYLAEKSQFPNLAFAQ